MSHEPTLKKPIRLWPGVIAGALLLLRYIVPLVAPATAGLGVLVGIAATLMVVVWWVFFSRVPWSERLGAIVIIAVAMFATSRVVHMSIAGGMMGMMFLIYGIQSMSLVLVVWAVASRRMSLGPRQVSLVAAVLITCGVWTLLRTDGIISGGSQLTWRWTPTAEERLLAAEPSAPTPPAIATATPAAPKVDSVAPAADRTARAPGIEEPGLSRGEAPATSEPAAMRVDWPGFRGPGRDGVVRGVRIETDWSASPPVETWRRPIGPGWSSFAVGGGRIYTQEQRGDDEVVACYELSTGKPVWMHRDKARFWESNAGAGPRATPTLSDGRVYTFGATGIVNVLDAASGAAVWSRNAAADIGATIPGWGFSSSPLVHDDVVIVAVAGQLVAYDRASGAPRWRGPDHSGGYSSPQLFTVDGVAQVVLLSGVGATSVAPADGAVLWEHAWAGGAIVQPARIADGELLINAVGMTGGLGTRRLAVARDASAGQASPGGWTVTERWTSNGLKPYFNDFVVHDGHAYGFDGSILACIDLADGKRKWKGGRYGDGQLVLLSEQNLLLVLSEEGELALVSATPDKFTEVARFKAIEGKTWNHPVLVGDVLLVRNGEEMAAFRLPTAGR